MLPGVAKEKKKVEGKRTEIAESGGTLQTLQREMDAQPDANRLGVRLMMFVGLRTGSTNMSNCVFHMDIQAHCPGRELIFIDSEQSADCSHSALVQNNK